MSGAKEPRRRLFFALWPKAAMQAALLAAASRTLESLRSGRPVPSENLHLTLAFLGSVPESSMPVLEETARQVHPASALALTLTFDAIEYWGRAQILCAAAHPPKEANEAASLAEMLKQALLESGFTPDLKPFRPHVTLARQVRHRPLERTLPEVTWTFNDFALIESRTMPAGSLYSIVASWALYRI